jgi:NAD(P)H-nitrite reductase large subunit
MEKLIICRCEEVTLADITNTAREYMCSAREVKLRTRASMGYCGGRVCRVAIDAILRDTISEGIQHDISLKIQSPVRPISLSTLGGMRTDE